MIYANPVASEYASGEGYEQLGNEYYLSPAKLESDYSIVRFARELRLFGKHCPGGAVLDVGCSTGGFLFQLTNRFPGSYEAMGTDASGPALDYAQSRGLAVRRGNFLEQDFGGRKFHAVTFWAVLEHVLEPKKFLEKALSLLEPNGLCFVLVPNMASLAVRLLGSRYRYIYPQHFNYFSRMTLIRFVPPAFSVVEMGSTHFNPLVIWQDWRSGGADVSNAQRAKLLERTTAYKRNAWLKPVRGMYGLAETALGILNLADNLIAVLRKKRY